MNAITIEQGIELFSLLTKYGVPAITDAIAKIKNNATEPTVEKIRAVMEGVEPPIQY